MPRPIWGMAPTMRGPTAAFAACAVVFSGAAPRASAETGLGSSDAPEAADRRTSAAPASTLRRRQPDPAAPPKLPETVVPGGAAPLEPPQPAPPPPPTPSPASPFAGTFYDSPFASPPAAGYGATRATGGTVVDTPLLSIPGGLGIVTADAMRDQQMFSARDAFRSVSGVTADHAAGNTATIANDFSYLSRGFPTSYRRWNGFRSDLVQSTIDTANVERLEFIKGPASVLYGASDAGGFLNVLTKKPLDEDFSNFGLNAGSWGLARTTVDFNRVLNDFTKFRLNVAVQNADSFRDFVNDDRTLIAPVVTVDLTDDCRLTVEAEYLSTNTKYDWGVLAVDGNLNALPRSRYLHAPVDTTFGDYWKTAVVLDQTLSDDWAARVGYYWSSAAQDVRTHTPQALLGDRIFQVPATQTTHGTLPTLNGWLTGTVQTGDWVHHVTAGMEFEWIQSAYPTIFYVADGVLFDPFNPVYATSFPPAAPAVYSSTDVQAQIGSIQDRIECSEHLEFVGGASYQNFDRKFTGAYAQGQDNIHGVTPRASVILHPQPGVSALWYSFTQSLNAQTLAYYSPDGPILQGTAGTQHEVGLRLTPSDDLAISLTAYDLQKTNVPFLTGTPGFATVAIPLDARSRGIEFDLYGKVSERLDVIANYAYIDVRAIDGGPISALGQLPLVPHNNANLWTRYNLFDSNLDRSGRRGGREVFGVGLGGRWVSSNTTLVFPGYYDGIVGGQQRLPGYVTVDAGLFYQKNRFSASLYLENLGDRTYYTNGIGAFINPGVPFNARASVGYRF